MGKMIDLSVFQEETLDMKMLDGRIVNIVKPTQKMVLELMNFQNLREEEPEAQIAALSTIVCKVLNSNKNKIIFTEEEVGEFSFQILNAILTAYGEFVNGIASNPN